MQGLDFGMDEAYSDFLSKKRRYVSLGKRMKERILRIKKEKAELRGDDKKVIRLNDKIRKIKTGRTRGGRRALGHTGVRIPASVLASRGKAKGLFGKKSCKEQLMRMRMGAGGMEKFIKKCESRGDFTASKVKKNSCKDKLRTMRLTQQGKIDFIAKCEANGDFTASLVKKKEKIASVLVANDIVKKQRAIDKIGQETESAKEQVAEQTKPLTEQKGFQQMLLPLLAGVGIVIFIGMKK